LSGTIIFVETQKYHFSKLFLLEYEEKAINELTQDIKFIFKNPSTKEFLQRLNKLLDLLVQNSIQDLSKYPFITITSMEEARIIVLNYSQFPENLYAITISKRVWENPKNSSERQISIEAQVIGRKGILASFQRVLVIRDDVVLDARF